ncbi:MAG TPA: UDP-N-acetylglucosamine 2-epimerase (non-hydrolyzing) [Lentisphaeria bacterium]|nr:MAG: UDP-N-acetylglucosamine 2-epimerase [Lentisphaerae bacterium GWF2_49_21]HBC87110.1 UDP-N-acetylglucosamine 2-epimerase (non-hydrolyzing) [Lentisphaeria bacterium]
MKICTIIGARPQFIKAAAVSAEIARRKAVKEVVIHTGQHYDHEMSEIFFRELGVPHEKYNLEAGSGLHGQQTGKMLEAMEKVLLKEKPDMVLVYGDTNSTLAGTLAASKLHIPIAHVEAGMRSFNRKMPEEINRIVADHLSDVNLCSTITAMKNLADENLGKSAVLVGDVMYDCAIMFAELAGKRCDPLRRLSLVKGKYALMTCHRAENTDDKKRLTGIIDAINMISRKTTVVYPAHPRTVKFIGKYGLSLSKNVRIIKPVGYLEMILLEKNASVIITDSGGIQKEAFFYRIPCITMRDETEWVETVKLGWNRITGADSTKITASFAKFAGKKPPATSAKPYGNGKSAAKIVNYLVKLR